MTIDRDEVYNSLIQIYNDETHDEIIERLNLIGFIKECHKTTGSPESDKSLSFLINQNIMKLENILFNLELKTLIN
jgi:hypothetical protein